MAKLLNRMFGAAALSTILLAGEFSPADAAGGKSFSAAAFKADQSAGKTVVLDFHADWCSTCKKQSAALEKILGQDEFKNVVTYVIDYDAATDLRSAHKVVKQSTLVVFKGQKEASRAVGVTAEQDIANLIRKGI